MKALTIGIMILVGLFCETVESYGQATVSICNLERPLTGECDGDTPLADGTVVTIYHDLNANGPDPNDESPFMDFVMNGEALYGIPGTFCTEPNLFIDTTVPHPWRFYIRILACELDAMWTSESFTVADGFQEINLINWECEPCPIIDDIPDISIPVVNSVTLHPNYPNPFNPSTEITFDLPHSMHASLKVYDVLGREVAELANGPLNAGTHTVTFDASTLSSGVYFYRLESGAFSTTRKMVLMK